VALSARLDRAHAVPSESRENALLLRVHAFIEARLGDPRLSPAMIAAPHHISLRSLHKLFEPRRETVASWIRQRRLERCRQDLLDPAQAHLPVSAIAMRWGFIDPTHFNRSFRRAHGVPPGQYRANGGRVAG
jgi:AraC-like DNA-binding protein